ncbi:MAG: M23 family metallopeptidase [Microbacterium hominis]|uniref:M23 family metallopeptidase n=1 Tax=Microbacterium aurum TaxID=36805 RepID=UPI00248EFEBD|nr:M23 family metallopeptidase [Microbacterium aurum]MBZ6371919.1 M23 family metallopeptidase [Microbacterium hominis]
MTLDTPTADAAPPRRATAGSPAAAAATGSGVLTRAEYRRRAAAAAAAQAATVETPASVEPAEEIAATPSLAEAVVADVAAAIAAETALGAQPDEASRRRLRRAARAVFEAVAEDAGAPSAAMAHASGTDAVGVPVADQLPPASAFVPSAPEADHRAVDEFEFAARLFSFTAETPVQRARVAEERPAADEPSVDAAHVAPRRARRSAGAVAKRVAAASFSLGVMAVVGLLAIGTTTPAEAVAAMSDRSADLTVATTTAKAAKTDIQAFVASGDAPASTLDRPESYNVASMAEIAADSGVTLFAGTWVNDPTAAIQWPFPVGVPISAAYGSSSYLSQFSTPHRGVDLTPGLGAEVYAVAAGTVRIATEAGGDYGVTVLIDHVIDGQIVSTRYGHMQYGSLRVKQGDTVTAGQVLGTVGQTGKATGPHLHLEVLLGGTAHTDPIEWLKEHTNGTHTVG